MLALWQDRQQEHDTSALTTAVSGFSSHTSELKADCAIGDLKPFSLPSSKKAKDLQIKAQTISFGTKKTFRSSFPGGEAGRKFQYQRTLKSEVEIVGIGLHSGISATLRVLPAKANTGLQIKRVDQDDAISLIEGRFDMVTDTQLCTKISNEANVSVGTVEHLLSALRAYEIDNALVEIDGPEVPVLDGSSRLICDALDAAGTLEQASPRQVIRVLKPISVGDDKCGASLRPGKGFELDFTIRFDCESIGEQSFSYKLDLDTYKQDICEARTFGFYEGVEQLRAMGLARGGSLDNAVVLKDGAVMNPEGLRFNDEFVRHKILDAVGDLYLAGLQIEGLYVGVCSGHRVNNELLRALFADPSAWTLAYQFEEDTAEVA